MTEHAHAVCHYIYMYIFPIFIHLSVRHVDSFNVFAIVKNAAMNIGVHISFELVFSFFLDIYPGVELQSNKYFICEGVFWA